MGVRKFQFGLPTATYSKGYLPLKFPRCTYQFLASPCSLSAVPSTLLCLGFLFPSLTHTSLHTTSVLSGDEYRSGQKPLGACLCPWLWACLKFTVFSSGPEPLSAERHATSFLSMSPVKLYKKLVWTTKIALENRVYLRIVSPWGNFFQGGTFTVFF